MDFDKIVIPKWHEVNTEKIVAEDCCEPLILLNSDNAPNIIYEPKYYQRKIPGAVKECYIREGVLNRLNSALKHLPTGYGFKIFDAWRPVEVQQFLFDEQVNKLIKEEFEDIDRTKEIAKRYVSFPIKNPKKAFVHSTGGAVDLTIIDKNKQELNMGTDFDDFSVLAAADAFEKSENIEVRNNRRMLFYALTSVGFTNYPSEWWHYDYGDSFWAAESNSDISVYGGIFKL